MSLWAAFWATMLAVLGAAILTGAIVAWDAWMERRGWRGWRRP